MRVRGLVTSLARAVRTIFAIMITAKDVHSLVHFVPQPCHAAKTDHAFLKQT